MTYLQLVQAAMGEMGLAVPSTVASNSSQDVIQMGALASGLGRELREEAQWQALCKEYRFTVQYLSTTGDVASGSAVLSNLASTSGLDTTYMVTGTGIPQDCFIQSVNSLTQVTLTQTATSTAAGTALTFGKTQYALPSDYDRPINRTHWDKSKHWQMLGPETPQQWQWIKSGFIATGPRIRYRLFGNYFQIWPLVASSEYLGFEYLSNAWVTGSTGTAKTAFTDDQDTCVFPDALFIAGLKARYFIAKGFDATAYMAAFARQLQIAKAADAGAPLLAMAGTPANVLIGPSNIPDSGYGL